MNLLFIDRIATKVTIKKILLFPTKHTSTRWTNIGLTRTLLVQLNETDFSIKKFLASYARLAMESDQGETREVNEKRTEDISWESYAYCMTTNIDPIVDNDYGQFLCDDCGKSTT